MIDKMQCLQLQLQATSEPEAPEVSQSATNWRCAVAVLLDVKTPRPPLLCHAMKPTSSSTLKASLINK